MALVWPAQVVVVGDGGLFACSVSFIVVFRLLVFTFKLSDWFNTFDEYLPVDFPGFAYCIWNKF